MSPDFRYHVSSLAAVFLALGIGILIGTAFFGTPTVDRLTRQIKNLEAREKELRTEAQETRKSEDALGQLLPGLIRGTLAGKRVLIVQTGTETAGAEQAALTVQSAGGIPLRVTLPAEAWKDISEGLTRTIARRLCGRSGLQEAGKDLVSGEMPDTSLNLIVLASGLSTVKTEKGVQEPSETQALQTRDQMLITTWQELGVTVVGVERLGVTVSSLPAYQKAGIATVDCIDRVAGQMALPFALRGEKGAFGMRPNATQTLPAALEAARMPTPKPSPTPFSLEFPSL
jgi:hypothetical protein